MRNWPRVGGTDDGSRARLSLRLRSSGAIAERVLRPEPDARAFGVDAKLKATCTTNVAVRPRTSALQHALPGCCSVGEERALDLRVRWLVGDHSSTCSRPKSPGQGVIQLGRMTLRGSLGNPRARAASTLTGWWTPSAIRRQRACSPHPSDVCRATTARPRSCQDHGVQLQWSDGTVAVRCPVCGREDGQSRVATSQVDWRETPVQIVRCRGCGAIVMSDVQPPTTFFADSAWDAYVEHGAGLEVIAQMLVRINRHEGSSMLDLGCGYGFALDLGSFLFGWRGIGLDPSVAADRGREDLGLDIRSGLLDDAFAPDETFDVVFASEVLEHVPDPAEFLASIADRLSDDGALLLTTPDADAVRPETALSELVGALSIGAHVFLVDAPGLERLLRAAGLEAIVWSEGPSLRALAARSAQSLARTRPDAVIDYADLARYCDARTQAAPVGSILQVGMAARHLKYSVNLGDYERARARLPRLRAAVLGRHGIDIDDPSATMTTRACGVLVGVHYFLGILALNGDGDRARAASHFAASAEAAKTLYRTHGEYRDPAPRVPCARAPSHRARLCPSTASSDPQSAVRGGPGGQAGRG